ncbi:MAG: glycosyltransferase, partial [Prevotella sp.]|nr:glycosyltransferase [Prevotella sp.]
MKYPSVSVIVPIYNVSKYIERCVRSLMEQTYANIEYIFVDDATPDDSMA